MNGLIIIENQNTIYITAKRLIINCSDEKVVRCSKM